MTTKKEKLKKLKKSLVKGSAWVNDSLSLLVTLSGLDVSLWPLGCGQMQEEAELKPGTTWAAGHIAKAIVKPWDLANTKMVPHH